MFERFTRFFLANPKATAVLMGGLAAAGIVSYALLPKQYNPTIVAPAFSVRVPAAGYDAPDAARFLVRELENRVMELPRVDKIYGYAADGYAAVTVMFEVGTDADGAKARIHDKLAGASASMPFGISGFSVASMDPEDLPQAGFAVSWSGTGLSEGDAGILVRSAALALRDELSRVPGTAAFELVGGRADGVAVSLDAEKMGALGLSAGEVLSKVAGAAAKSPAGEVSAGGSRAAVTAEGGAADGKSLASLPVATRGNSQILLSDVASLGRGPADDVSFSFRADRDGTRQAAFLGVAKAKGSNAVEVSAAARAKAGEFAAKLPDGLSVTVVHDEGETARHATRELMFHLAVSIAVVFGVLAAFLGLRDALNAAACIPLVLAIVFAVALAAGLDINRITLFALILSLGILVDDSIVVVENNARHLADRARTGLSADDALAASVAEVGPSVAFSTAVRILSFVAMFAVTGMMGDYMGPIPVFSSVALAASLAVAFSVNPFLAKWLRRGKAAEEGAHAAHGGKWAAAYGRLLGKFVAAGPEAARRRKILKRAFWAGLAAVMVLPVAAGTFRARMLPKADKGQIWVWIDADRDAPVSRTLEMARAASDFLLGRAERKPEARLLAAREITASAGAPVLGDFANMFRGGSERRAEWQASLRVNLDPDRKISSGEYAESVRGPLESYLADLYPEARLRVLEEPPGPPAAATLHLKAKAQEGTPADALAKFARALERQARKIAAEEGVVDLQNDLSTPARQFRIVLDQDALERRGVAAEAALAEIARWASPTQAGFVRGRGGSREPAAIAVSFPRETRDGAGFLRSVRVPDARGGSVRLDEVARVETGFAGREIRTDGREPAVNVTAEISGNSVVYPVLRLYGLFGSAEFAAEGYEKVSYGPYGMTFRGTADGREYRMEWGGEWEITMDTFRDLGTAMGLSLAAIYFLLVVQFRSFRAGGIVMTPFLMSLYGIMPGFSLLHLLNGTYFTATAMIGAIALGGIVVGNAIIMADYVNQLFAKGMGPEYSVVHGSAKRFAPVLLTSLAAIAGSLIIAADPVWGGLAWAIAWGLSASAALTLLLVPAFYYDYLLAARKGESEEIRLANVEKNFLASAS